MKKLFLSLITLATASFFATADVVKDEATYSIEGYTLENQWIKALRYDNFPSISSTESRSMVYTQGKLAFPKRTAASSVVPATETTPSIIKYADLGIMVYDPITGTQERIISLPDTLLTYLTINEETNTEVLMQLPTLCLTDMQVDAGGNILVCNFIGNIFSTSPATDNVKFKIYAIDVDLATGEIRDIKRVLNFRDNSENAPNETPHRIDYFNIIGDATSGEAYIFAATDQRIVYRWKLEDGVCDYDYTEPYSLDALPKSNLTTTPAAFGSVSRIFPITPEVYYLDCTNSIPALYSEDTMVDSFDDIVGDGSDHFYGTTTNKTANNGMAMFSIGEDHFKLFSYTNNTFTDGAKAPLTFILTKDGENATLAEQKEVVVFPANGMAKDGIAGNSQANRNGRVVVSTDGDVAHIFVYHEANGLAYYTFKVNGTGIKNVNTSNVKMFAEGLTIRTNEVVNNIEVRTVTGQLVVNANNTSSVELSNSGIYLVRLTDKQGLQTVSKLSIR